MISEVVQCLGACIIWFIVGYFVFEAKTLWKEARKLEKLRHIFVYKDIVIRMYGDVGDPDLHKIAHLLSTYLKIKDADTNVNLHETFTEGKTNE